MSDFDLDKVTYEPRFREGFGATGATGVPPSDFDLDKVTYEPRFREGFGGTGATGVPPKLHDKPMVYWVGRCYGPYETEEEAKKASAELLAERQHEDQYNRELERAANAVKKKLTAEEWEAVYSLGARDGRGY